MGYIPYIPPPVHYDSHSSIDPKMGTAIWIACHVLPLMFMLTSFVYNKFVTGDWRRYDLPPLFEFFAIWLAAVVFLDLLGIVTYAIMLLL